MTSKLYISEETEIDLTDDTTGGDYTLDLGADGASGNVANSDQIDLGAAPRSEWYRVTVIIDGFATAPVVDEAAHIGFAAGRSTSDIDGDFPSTSGSTGTVDDLKNIDMIDRAIVQTTTAADELRISFKVRFTARYQTAVVYNATADAFASSGDAHHIYITPIPPQGQDT